MHAELTDQEALRYNRQIVLRGFDFDGQEALKAATVLVVGLGGLGCAASQYLAAAGIGKLKLLDFDRVSLSNLQRQTLHCDSRIDMLKVESAQLALSTINPHVQFSTHSTQLSDNDLSALILTTDVVLDCTDNVATRDQLNRLCYSHKIPLVSAAAIRMEGQITVFTYQDGEPCYHCLSRLFGEQVLSCVEAGVMAPLVGIMGSLQAMESIKLITHFGETLRGRLLLVDTMTMQFQSMVLPQNPQCMLCHQPKLP